MITEKAKRFLALIGIVITLTLAGCAHQPYNYNAYQANAVMFQNLSNSFGQRKNQMLYGSSAINTYHMYNMNGSTVHCNTTGMVSNCW